MLKRMLDEPFLLTTGNNLKDVNASGHHEERTGAGRDPDPPMSVIAIAGIAWEWWAV